MKTSTKRWYKDLPEIGYQMKPYAKDGKVTLPNRGKGNYDADLYFGRGVKFNGVDQSILINTIPIVGTMTIVYTMINGPYSDFTRSKVIGRNGGYRYFTFRNNSTFVARFGIEVDIKLNVTLMNGSDHTIAVTFDNLLISVYVDGVFAGSGYDDGTYSTSFGVIGGDTKSYSNSGISNVIFFNNTVLTPNQIKYQYTNPERFLYHEKQLDGTFIAKSEMLNQSEIDNVVAHFPLCETDGYVRNMIWYSEGSNTITSYFKTDFGTDTTGTFSSTTGTLDVTVAGTSTINPRVDYNISSNRLVGDTLLYEFDYVVNSGTCICRGVYDGVVSGGKTLTGSGHYSHVSLCITERATNSLYFNGTNLFNVTITNISVKKLSSTYKINNFTNAVRDNAKHLQSGLQTCFLKRDKLGVPIGSSFNELACDGVGYASCDYFVEDRYTVFETIMYLKSPVAPKTSSVIGGYSANKLYLGMYDSGNGMLKAWTRYGGLSAQLVVTGGYYHLTVVADPLGNIEGFVNGVSIGATAYSFTTPSSGITLGMVAPSGTYKVVEPIRLFKIHTTPQDPAQLYADAVSKGLLAPEGALQDANGNYIIDSSGSYILTT